MTPQINHPRTWRIKLVHSCPADNLPPPPGRCWPVPPASQVRRGPQMPTSRPAARPPCFFVPALFHGPGPANAPRQNFPVPDSSSPVGPAKVGPSPRVLVVRVCPAFSHARTVTWSNLHRRTAAPGIRGDVAPRTCWPPFPVLTFPLNETPPPGTPSQSQSPGR